MTYYYLTVNFLTIIEIKFWFDHFNFTIMQFLIEVNNHSKSEL